MLPNPEGLRSFLASPRALKLALALLTLGTLFASALELRVPQRGPYDPTWAFLQQHRILVVGVDPSLPPFGRFGENRPLGFDPAVAEEIARRLGMQIRWVLLTYDGLYDSLLLGQTDMVIAALRRDPLREDRIRYSSPYFDAGQVILSREGLQQLENERVGVEFASEADLALRERPDLKLQRFLTPEEALSAAESGAVDAALVDAVSAQLYLATHAESRLIMAQETLLPAPYVIALRRRDWRLHLAVEEALAGMRADATLAALVEQWISRPAPPPP